MMNPDDFARRALKRMGAFQSPPEMEETSQRLWLDMLDLHWDYYAELVAGRPNSSEWTRHGWKFAPTDTSNQAQTYFGLLKQDMVLEQFWAALKAFRPVWNTPPESREYIEALAGVSRMLWGVQPTDYFFELPSCINTVLTTPAEGAVNREWANRFAAYQGRQEYVEYSRLRPYDKWRHPTGDEFTEYVLFESWLAREMLAAEDKHHLAHILSARAWKGTPRPRHRSFYEDRQYELKLRQAIAFHEALAGFRQQIINRVPPDDIDASAIHAALAMSRGNFDERSQAINYSQLSPEKRAEYDQWKKENGLYEQ